ncbi:MAG: rod shape-determining protein RodA [Dysgonamonadaceae bacterium]|jgi:rod shape determining protein RodA|nr:rod shape-determining protein RodA [Dysgonamonadaceae bacterium]
MYQANNEKIEKGSIDWISVGFYLLFIIMGWFSIYAASFDLDNATSIFDLSGRAGKQLIWMGASLIVAFAIMKIDTSFYETYALLFYSIGILLLLITLVIAPDINGSRSWFVLGPIRFQPAEFMKFLIALALSRIFNMFNFKLMTTKNLLLVSTVILFPALIVIMQSETGTALVYLSFILVLYREGLPGVILFIGLAAIALFVMGVKFSADLMGMFSLGEFINMILIILFIVVLIWAYVRRWRTAVYVLGLSGSIFLAAFLTSLFGIKVDYSLVALIALISVIFYVIYLFLRYRLRDYLWILLFALFSIAFTESIEFAFNDVLQPHQQMRIKVALGMEEDLQGSGYHVGQSKIAIGSGGLSGKGYLNGTQTKLKYVPEQDTDFIFCTIGEEFGFIGSSVIVILFLIFIIHLATIAERQTTIFGRVYGYGVVSVFAFHLLVNIGMVIGLVPVIGIPLPLFSYGGSSLLGFTIMLFIFLRIDQTRRRL